MLVGDSVPQPATPTASDGARDWDNWDSSTVTQ
jgi:hypothetical protein